ncbi:MAG: hypothetical protein AB7G93_02495 [Bdellovibrionales bacterium]
MNLAKVLGLCAIMVLIASCATPQGCDLEDRSAQCENLRRGVSPPDRPSLPPGYHEALDGEGRPVKMHPHYNRVGESP